MVKLQDMEQHVMHFTLHHLPKMVKVQQGL